MALVEVARFIDLTEAQAASAALRASGVPVHLQNENFGQIEPHIQMGLGGFILWAPEEEAADARAFIVASRRDFAPARAPLPEAAAPAQGLGVFLLALASPAVGYLLAPFRRRPLPDDDEEPQA